MDLERTDLCRRADQLGIAWTHGDSNETLRECIAEKENSMGSVLWKDGKWHIEGNPPNQLQFVNNTWVTADGDLAPECFGELWDAVGPQGSDMCKHECDFSPVCMELMAKQTLPAAQIRLGAGHSLEALAPDLNVCADTIMALTNYLKGGAHPLQHGAKKKAPPPAVEPAMLEKDSEDEDELDPSDETIEDEGDVLEEEDLDTSSEDSEVTAPEEEVKAVNKKKKAPAQTKSKAKKEAKAKVKAKVGGPVPQKAPSVKRAKAGVSAKEQAKVALPAKAQVECIPTDEDANNKSWGEHTFRARWERERERSKLIAQLQPGMVLRVTHKKQECETKVLKEGYLVKGVKVPTLYMTVLPYTGTVARPKQDGTGERQVGNYSAAKFWRLKELFDKSVKVTDPRVAKLLRKTKAKKGRAGTKRRTRASEVPVSATTENPTS